MLENYGNEQKPLYMAKECENLLEYTRGGVTMMLVTVDKREILKRKVHYGGITRKMSFLTEFGLWELMLYSTKPNANEFKRLLKEKIKKDYFEK